MKKTVAQCFVLTLLLFISCIRISDEGILKNIDKIWNPKLVDIFVAYRGTNWLDGTDTYIIGKARGDVPHYFVDYSYFTGQVDVIENEQIKKTGAGDFFSKQEIADIIKFFQKARVFLLSIDSLGNMRIRINKNDSIEYLKVVDSPANHKRIVRKMYGNWYIAEAMHF
ncbi:hypothetical protein [Leyella lascolaii]|uniref:hypothetical protein n=1 Tax=Leyella lascolaii TaxID=1776379 RepID=UPI0029430E95|nr:hypothetical protein [Leyella lascolaii]